MEQRSDRIRRHTAREVLRRIDDSTTANLAHWADQPPQEIQQRLQALDREWDTDRVLEVEAASMGLLGLALGAFYRPRFLALPAFVAAAVLTHALTGRYPLMPIFRRLGLRTAKEIARERYALKALRGDFAGMARSSEAAATASAIGRTEPGRPEPDDPARPELH